MINIAEILKDCPKGMQLYSPICGECKLMGVINNIIKIEDKDEYIRNFLSDGKINANGECLLFPSSDNIDWNKFRPFKDGDIISNGGYIAIFHKFGKPEFCSYDKVVYYHCWYDKKYKESKFEYDFGIGRDTDYRFATDEEKQKLFDVIKENGYKWNSETKTLEKLIIPTFKVGDIIAHKDDKNKVKLTITCVKDTHYLITFFNDKKGDYQSEKISLEYQDKYNLVISNKFDISTFKAYDKVLVRDGNTLIWVNAFFGFYDAVTEKYPFVASASNWAQCIPYEGNEHLLGTCDDCNEYYKNW